ncbi:DUF1176 domain-containing protein [Pseudoduganella chitinolytica]|uniref:DUF1176 domain-containing protein n=1 Tax=Pseudoduganella chitinolytica TaxID=34070 RepID=A0ABY8B5W0_9BURK|nr:DUF1176 domain-containing protein [Pseudoduganella chitinolytica]WEF31121.1 DUF1176 domain-containing protein [Pseudoduganella chitinolytica]
MQRHRLVTAPVTLVAWGIASLAAAAPYRLNFEYRDWQLMCDNTRTCRALGYNAPDGISAPVALFLSRKAGPGEAVQAQLFINEAETAVPGPGRLAIGGRDAGTVTLAGDPASAALSRAQADALLQALPGKDGKVTLTQGNRTWTVSDAGAAAMLLKMDEVQGRLGTPGAASRKGDRPEATVPPAPAAPLVLAQPLPLLHFPPAPQLFALAAALRRDPFAAGCEGLAPGTRPQLQVGPLGHGKLLAEAVCHSGSRETIRAYWIVNAAPPYAPRLVADDVTQLHGEKLRSIAASPECGSGTERVWDGRDFVVTYSWITGQCGRLFPFWLWQLPTFQATVRRP